MKPKQILAHAFSLLALSGTSLLAQNTVTVDPANPLVDFTSLAEWNSNGDQENWVANNLTPTVAGGSLSGTTTTGDTQLVLNPFAAEFPTGAPSIVTVEFQLTRPGTDGSAIQIFWNDNSGGFSAARSLVLPGVETPLDGLPHVYQFELRNVNTNLRGLRIDASQANGVFLEFDYVRLRIKTGTPVLDPTETLNSFTSLGEWNTDGNQEGWSVSSINSLNVSGGGFSGLTSGNDPQFILRNLALDSTTDDFDFVEIRLRKESSDTSRLDFFWADDNGNVSPLRKAVLPAGQWPADGQFHILQIPLGDFLTGTVTQLRFDPVSDSALSRSVTLDYVRLGRIEADDDNDGLANSVETDTGNFLTPSDTGTDPNDDDSDNDTFLDGVEVAFGTDPNDSNDFPEPSVTSYTESPAFYDIDIAITDNAPVVANGAATGFEISPALPAGLLFNEASGVISGTPTAASPATVYTVTATFAGAVTSDFELTLEVLNPGIERYLIVPAVYQVGSTITANTPVTFGVSPTGFTIAPSLPDGLILNTINGTITGTATVSAPATDYTVTANYESNPDATYDLNITVKAIPVVSVADGAPLVSYVSLGEWETAGDLDGWAFARATGTASGGILTFNATGADPQMSQGGVLDLSQGTTLEFRLRQPDTEILQVFWVDGSGGLSPDRRVTIEPTTFIPDGQFHLYQIDFEDVFVGNVSFLRIDPGNTGGRFVEIDHIRIGSTLPPADPAITDFNYDPVFGDIEITWTSTLGTGYTIESSPDLTEGSWTPVVERNGDAETTSYIGSPGTDDRFFRVMISNP